MWDITAPVVDVAEKRGTAQLVAKQMASRERVLIDAQAKKSSANHVRPAESSTPRTPPTGAVASTGKA